VLKKIGLAVAAVIVVFVIVVATRPAEFHYERSVVAEAPADAVFPLVNDFHRWAAWSPWDKMDPKMQRTFDGAPAGIGAKYAWTGNSQVGEGRMSVEESKANELVKIKLEFVKPFTATNLATFTIRPTGKGVTVTWAMDGQNSFIAKAIGLFVDMDKMIGNDFERGLAGIKDLAQQEVVHRAEEAKKAAEKAAAAGAPAPPIAAVGQ
jgi:hypothetical protein